MLKKKQIKYEITNELDKAQSTIAREINLHNVLKLHDIYKNTSVFNCKYFNNCKVCTNKGRIFQPIACKERSINLYNIK